MPGRSQAPDGQGFPVGGGSQAQGSAGSGFPPGFPPGQGFPAGQGGGPIRADDINNLIHAMGASVINTNIQLGNLMQGLQENLGGLGGGAAAEGNHFSKKQFSAGTCTSLN